MKSFLLILRLSFGGLLASVAAMVATGAEFTLESASQAAEQGQAEAQYFLARSFARGLGVPQDYSKAARYLRDAAQQGYARAENDLGALYARGLGVPQDFEE